MCDPSCPASGILGFLLSRRLPIPLLSACAAPANQTARFDSPMANSLPLDHCISQGRDCDLPAALMWCQMNGWAAVIDFKSGVPAAKTFIPAQNRACTAACTTFAYIVCGRSGVAAVVASIGTGSQQKPANTTKPGPNPPKPTVTTAKPNTTTPAPVKKAPKTPDGSGVSVSTTVVVTNTNTKCGTPSKQCQGSSKPAKTDPPQKSNSPKKPCHGPKPPGKCMLFSGARGGCCCRRLQSVQCVAARCMGHSHTAAAFRCE